MTGAPGPRRRRRAADSSRGRDESARRRAMTSDRGDRSRGRSARPRCGRRTRSFSTSSCPTAAGSTLPGAPPLDRRSDPRSLGRRRRAREGRGPRCGCRRLRHQAVRDRRAARATARSAAARSASSDPVVELGELVVDLEKRLVTLRGDPVSLTPTEFELLSLFVQNEGKLLTHPAILRAVWGPSYRTSPTTSTSTSRSFGGRSKPTRRGRGTS